MRFSARLLPFCAAFAGSFGGIQPAFADPAPVVTVNREVGLSITGGFENAVNAATNIVTSSGTNWKSSSYSHERFQRVGWTPGFQAEASVMFDAFGIRNLYASGQFVLQDGQRNAKYAYRSASDGWNSSGRFGGNDASKSTMTHGEIGKGFLLVSDSFLVTPFAQGGYLSTGGDSFGGYGSAFFVGAGLKADYALTPRLVLRGRFGWAQLLEHDPGYYRTEHYSRPMWEGGLSMDYRLTHHLHMTAGGNYTYISDHHGHDGTGLVLVSNSAVPNSVTASTSSSSFVNGATLHLGLAYAF
ncbi:hypothetical protein [Gluconobacter morbifer]|uniref:Outer membrane protease n=1 Tax=Gluconobacter morbifer G707 TaxID=1088869 RepID=G6XJH1_9PROT|nr:hypothetical protein [Gluconobacter morbifer]EHH68076.1 hypothetical protein GMO_18430 [Gluconobacter morbifer G707]